jgi:putative ABC transport system permease protein
MKSRNVAVRFSNWLLGKIYDEGTCSEIEGDLIELYNSRVEAKGRTKASLLYLWDAILSVRNIGLKKKRKSFNQFPINPIAMLRNIVKVALRSLKKDAVFSGINILGLTIGITCSMFLFLYIMDELSYDRYHRQSKNIYRVITHFKDASSEFTWPGAEMPLAEALRNNYPQVKNAASFRRIPEEFYQYGDKRFLAHGFYMADPQVFQVFDYKFLYGDPTTALKSPRSMVLTESVARRYFTIPESALDQSLKTEKGEEFKITGIIQDVPLNSHFRFNGLITENNELSTDWLAIGAYTYMVLQEGYNPLDFHKELKKLVQEKVAPAFDKAGLNIEHELQPITDIHLHSKIAMEESTSGDLSYLYTFGVVAFFLITIACINYMNLATGRSLNRAKEIGVRKVLGSQRSAIVYQFLLETVMLSVLSLVISFVLIALLLPSFNTLAGKQLEYSYVFQPNSLLILISLMVFIGVVGGSYPALYLSDFNPSLVLKGKFRAKGGSLIFRKSLVVTLFAISIFMLFSTLVVFNQLKYMKSQSLGFDTQKVFRLDLTQQMIQGRSVLVEKLKQLPGIGNVADANSSPGKIPGKLVFSVPDDSGQMTDKTLNSISATWDFVKTMGMTIVEGRDFSRDVPADQKEGVLVNETFAKLMGWKDPIGKKFFQKLNGSFGDVPHTVVGVIRDFNQRALKSRIEPLIIKFGSFNQYVFIRYNGDVRETLASVEKVFKEIYPDHAFVYNFLDQDFNTQYKSDETRGRIFTIFSALSIFISCLGLIGFTAFTIERRLKEISIRKVSGASISSLWILISADFFILVLIGIVIASPPAYYFTSRWLQNFAYKIALESQWVTFLSVVVFTFFITLLTILFHVYRAASLNPVQVLKNE